MSNIMFVPAHDSPHRRLLRHGADLRSADRRAPNPSFNPALPISAANPQFVRTQFARQQDSGRIGSTRSHSKFWQKYVVEPNLDDPTDNYLDTRAQEFQNDGFNLRLDRAWGNGTSLFGRYSLSNETGFTPENLPGFGAYHDNRVQNLSVTLVNPTTTSLLTETRFGFARMRLHRFGETANGADSGEPARYPRRRFRRRGRLRSAAVRHSGIRSDSAIRCCAHRAATTTTTFRSASASPGAPGSTR